MSNASRIFLDTVDSLVTLISESSKSLISLFVNTLTLRILSLHAMTMLVALYPRLDSLSKIVTGASTILYSLLSEAIIFSSSLG